MKKAKVMFTALTVLAVVGGALAFKAKTLNNTFLYTSSANGECVISLDGRSAIFQADGTVVTQGTIANSTPSDCSQPTSYVLE